MHKNRVCLGRRSGRAAAVRAGSIGGEHLDISRTDDDLKGLRQPPDPAQRLAAHRSAKCLELFESSEWGLNSWQETCARMGIALLAKVSSQTCEHVWC